MTGAEPRDKSGMPHVNVPSWIQQVCGRIERELIRLGGEDFASEAELERRLIETTFKVLFERRQPDRSDTETNYLITKFREHIRSKLLSIAHNSFGVFSTVHWEILSPGRRGFLQVAGRSDSASERVLTFAEIAKREGQAISWNPSGDPRLLHLVGESTSMLAVRLDDEEASANIILAVADVILPEASPVAERQILSGVAQACKQLQFTLRKCAMIFDLAELLHDGSDWASAASAGATVDSVSRTSQIKALYTELAKLNAQRIDSPDDTDVQNRFVAAMNDLRALQSLEAAAIEKHSMEGLHLNFDEGEKALAIAEEMLAKYAIPSSSNLTSE